MKDFYTNMETEVEETLNLKAERKVGDRLWGTDPDSGKPVFAKIGRYGTVIQIGSAEDEEKPRFAQMKAGQSMETITLEEALEQFKLPRTLGEYEEMPVSVGAGRFGPYILHNKKYVSLPKTEDPMTVSLEKAVELIEEKRKAEQERHIKKFEEEAELEILNGRYGPYIAYKGKNYRLPKAWVEKAKELELADCMQIIKEQDEKPATRKRVPAKKKWNASS